MRQRYGLRIRMRQRLRAKDQDERRDYGLRDQDETEITG